MHSIRPRPDGLFDVYFGDVALLRGLTLEAADWELRRLEAFRLHH